MENSVRAYLSMWSEASCCDKQQLHPSLNFTQTHLHVYNLQHLQLHEIIHASVNRATIDLQN